MDKPTISGPQFADGQTISRVITHPIYRADSSTLSSFLIQSRAFRDDPAVLLQIQEYMAGMLLQQQASQRWLEAQAADTGTNDDARAEARVGVAATRRLAHLVRQIADGIAWRFFEYDRVRLYQLALKPQTGHLEPAIETEIHAARKHVARGVPVLLNDLTNFVKYGDLTLNLDGAIKIVEVKSGRGSGKSGHATRQWQRLTELAEFLNSESRQTGNGNHHLVRFKTEPRTHLSAVQNLIREARRQGNAHARLSSSVAVDVFHVEAAATTSVGRRLLLNVRHNPFSQSKNVMTAHSLDLFYHFSPNRVPYALFPWPDDDCGDVLTGNIWIVSYFNWERLARTLKKRGLIVQELEAERLRRFTGLPIGDQRLRGFEVGLAVGRPNSRPCIISFAEFARLAYEFLDEECVADTIEEVLDIGIPPGDLYFTGFSNEAVIWN